MHSHIGQETHEEHNAQNVESTVHAWIDMWDLVVAQSTWIDSVNVIHSCNFLCLVIILFITVDNAKLHTMWAIIEHTNSKVS